MRPPHKATVAAMVVETAAVTAVGIAEVAVAVAVTAAAMATAVAMAVGTAEAITVETAAAEAARRGKRAVELRQVRPARERAKSRFAPTVPR